MKTWYALRIRMNDRKNWSAVSWYATRKERDRDSGINRIIGGIMTHSYEERFPDGVDPNTEQDENVRRTLGATERRMGK